MIGELDHIYYWVRDMDAAVAFYRDVLGLSLIRRDGDEWAEFDAGPVRLALHGVEGRGHGSVTAVFRVDDLDGASIALREVHRRPRRGGRGSRFATVRDPDGNGAADRVRAVTAETCPRCGQPLPRDANFCPNCGAPVAVPAVSERRVVTVVFADLAGSTELAAGLDPSGSATCSRRSTAW